MQVLARARQLLAEADDPWARRRAIRLEEVRERTVAIDRRTGSTTTDLWPSGAEPTVEHTQDIDDWLAVIATGRCVGIAPRRHRPRFGPVPPAAVSGRYPGRSHTRGLSATSRSRRSERPR